MRIFAQRALKENYTLVCLNSRGINSEMTSPIPFVGINFHELQAALTRVETYHPNIPIHIIGISLGGNYVLRYLLQNKRKSVNSLSLISAPFDIKFVIDNMNQTYQKYFIKYYISSTIERHEEMKFWWNNKIIDIKLLK